MNELAENELDIFISCLKKSLTKDNVDEMNVKLSSNFRQWQAKRFLDSIYGSIIYCQDKPIFKSGLHQIRFEESIDYIIWYKIHIRIIFSIWYALRRVIHSWIWQLAVNRFNPNLNKTSNKPSPMPGIRMKPNQNQQESLNQLYHSCQSLYCLHEHHYDWNIELESSNVLLHTDHKTGSSSSL